MELPPLFPAPLVIQIMSIPNGAGTCWNISKQMPRPGLNDFSSILQALSLEKSMIDFLEGFKESFALENLLSRK